MSNTNSSSIAIGSLKELVALLLAGEYQTVAEHSDHLIITEEELLPFTHWKEGRYARNCIARDENFELVLLCWEPNQKTDIHCHNNQECWVKVISGSFTEELYRIDESDKVDYLRTETLERHQTTVVEDPNVFHNLANTNTGRSMSLHLYMKPIEECRVYDADTKEIKKVSLCYHSLEGQLV